MMPRNTNQSELPAAITDRAGGRVAEIVLKQAATRFGAPPPAAQRVSQSASAADLDRIAQQY